MANPRPTRHPTYPDGKWRQGYDEGDAKLAARLKQAAASRRAWDDSYEAVLLEAIDSGMSDTAIANLAGITRQAVRQFDLRRRLG